MITSSKIIEFPSNSDVRLENTIKQFEETDKVRELINEFTQLVDEGHLEAWYYLGCLYEEGGEGVEPDYDKAVWYYQKSADEHGYLEGILSMGRIYYYGLGVNKGLNESLEYYNLAYNHNKKTVATFMLGRIYQSDDFEGKDFNRAEIFYRESIENEFVYGLLGLSQLEKEKGNSIKGLYYRLKAGLSAFNIARKDPRDLRLRPG